MPEGRLQRIQGLQEKDTSVLLTPLSGVKMLGAGRKRPLTVVLEVRDDSPLPELLLDTRPVAIRSERYVESVGHSLVSSGANSAAELQSL